MIAKILKVISIEKKGRKTTVHLEDDHVVENETHVFTNKTERVVFIPEGTLVKHNLAISNKLHRTKAVQDTENHDYMVLTEDVAIPIELIFSSGFYIKGTRVKHPIDKKQCEHYDEVLGLKERVSIETEDPFCLDCEGCDDCEMTEEDYEELEFANSFSGSDGGEKLDAYFDKLESQEMDVDQSGEVFLTDLTQERLDEMRDSENKHIKGACDDCGEFSCPSYDGGEEE